MVEFDKIPHKLNINLESFNFAVREKKGNKTVIYRCGRDFFYYALHFYRPQNYNVRQHCPTAIESEALFGLRLPTWLMWTLMQFANVPATFKKAGLSVTINDKLMRSWLDFSIVFALPKPVSFENLMSQIEERVQQNKVTGIDISHSWGGLVDHVMFVYGYDADNVYVFDTNQVAGLEYIKITGDERFIMKFPKEALRKRAKVLARIWKVDEV